MEVKLAIVALDFAPAFRVVEDSPQCGLVFLKKIAAQTRLALFIPERSGFQFLRHLRMPDDSHGAWLECPESFLLPSGHPPGPQPARENAVQ